MIGKIMKEYSDKNVKFHLQPLSPTTIAIIFQGKSTVQGTDVFFQWIEEEIEKVGAGKLNVVLDLEQLVSIPISVQLKMASWLLKIKNSIAKVAVVGGKRSAKMLAKGAKMNSVKFFDSRMKAEEWLGFSS